MGIDVFNLKAKISLDTKEYEKGLSESKSLFSSFGDGLKSAAGAVGNVLADVAKGATVAIGAAGTALTALTKQSLDIFANFEQLEGGTKLMFGDAADYIIQKSEEAYKTVQLSQNEYLQQVNGFAVGLKTALGGNEQAAAELANKIVQAEADIVAATGNTQEMVQNAFNGIMRNNYMMLDNLGLGIKPTKEGMEEVIQKVNEWNAANGEATSYVIDNLADVQAALVDYVEMQGMAGYASMEAGSTITGSIAGVKAAWQNFLSGNGNVKDFTDMLIPTVKNIREKLDTIIPRLTEGLTELVDNVSPYIPELIEETLPSIISGASSLLTGLAERLPSLITTILPALADGVLNVSVALVGALPQLIESLKESIPIVVKTIMSKKDDLKKAGQDIITAIFPNGFDPESIRKIVQKADDIIGKLIDGLLSQDSINQFVEAAPKIIENLVEAIKTILLGSEQDGEGGLFGAAKKIIENLGEYFADEKNRQTFIENADKIIRSLGSAIISILQNGVAPLMVEAAKAWMEVFIGDIDYTDAASEIIKRLGEAFLHNMMTGGILGKWIDEAAEDYLEKEIDPGIGYQPSTDYYTSEGMVATGNMPAAAMSSYLSSRGFLAANYSEVPTISNANTSYGDNVTNITINAPSGNAEDISNSLVATLDERMALFQAQNNRGFGYVGR